MIFTVVSAESVMVVTTRTSDSLPEISLIIFVSFFNSGFITCSFSSCRFAGLCIEYRFARI